MDRTRADWVDGRMPPTVLVTGVGGGYDLHLRDLKEHAATLLAPEGRVPLGLPVVIPDGTFE